MYFINNVPFVYNIRKTTPLQLFFFIFVNTMFIYILYKIKLFDYFIKINISTTRK